MGTLPTFEQFWKAFVAEVDRRAFSTRELEDGHHSEVLIGSIDWHRAAAKVAWEQLHPKDANDLECKAPRCP